MNSHDHIIKVEVVSTILPPLRSFIEKASYAIVHIAPEKVEKLVERIDEEITVRCLDSDEWECESSGPLFRLILISKKVYELLWTSSYCYALFYIELIEKDKINFGGMNFINPNSAVGKGLSLLKWSLRNWDQQNGLATNWPKNLPRPLKDPEPGSIEQLTDLLSESAFAFTIFHELFHIFEEGRDLPKGKEGEKEVDKLAASWIMNGISDKESPEYFSRLVGIAIATIVLSAKDIHGKHIKNLTHPSGFERMKYLISTYEPKLGNKIWHLIAAALTIHMAFVKIDVSKVIVNDPGEVVDKYVELLKQNGYDI